LDLLIHYILPFFGMLIFLIVAHEAGHYVTAKLFGVKVLEAGIGYPPRAWGFAWHGTIYSVNYLPLGGFVRLLGEEDPTHPESFAAQRAWKRLIILVSGAAVNFVLPVILFGIYFMIPHDVPRGPAIIDTVVSGSPAAAAGLKQGDQILEINGTRIKNTEDAGREIRLRMGETIAFTVQRTTFGETVVETLYAKARWDPPEGQGPTGIQIHDNVAGSAVCTGGNPPDKCYEREAYGPLGAIEKGWDATRDSLKLARNQVIAMFKGGQGPAVAGPTGIAQGTGEVIKSNGWDSLLQFAALLSINLAIINVLPLPMLDGGRMTFVLIEILRRGKRIAPEKEAIVHLVGLALIITMAVAVTYVDIARIIGGKSIFS
jgi:regulator of sigma E protease